MAMEEDFTVNNDTQRQSHENIVGDGAICPERYKKEKRKIVHLLKEPTETNMGSLAEAILKNGNRSQ
jgi:hypothetical protein